jgi:hypothetical protein
MPRCALADNTEGPHLTLMPPQYTQHLTAPLATALTTTSSTG